MKVDDKAQTLALRMPPLADAVRYFTDPAVVIGVIELGIFLIGVVELSRGAKQPLRLSRGESLAMHWHLANGIIIYTIMDGLTGGFSEYGFMPQLFQFYRTLDRRYHRDLAGTPSGPSAYETYVVFTVNATEVLVYSWMSIAVAVGIATRAKWHKTLEVVVLTMAAYGSVIFMAPDMLDGCQNQQPHGEVGCFPTLTPFTFFFVYFVRPCLS